MPNRIICESICTSESIDALTWFEEVFFIHLLTHCDDKGKMDARPKILKACLFPLKDVRLDQVESALQKLSSLGMVELYEVDGRPYLKMITWEKYQRVRDVKSKYPDPPAAICGNLPQSAANCGKPPLSRARAESESESNPNTNPNPNPNPTRVQKDLTPFDLFWDTYPKKSGDMRQACIEYDLALDEVSPEELQKAVEEYAASIDDENMQYVPSADKWLRNRRWREKPRGKQKKPPRTFTPTQFD